MSVLSFTGLLVHSLCTLLTDLCFTSVTYFFIFFFMMQENFRVKGKKLYFGFVDLEKAFDRVPREVISWAMRKLGVEEWLVSAVVSMYTGAKTVVRTVYGNSKGFQRKSGYAPRFRIKPVVIRDCHGGHM